MVQLGVERLLENKLAGLDEERLGLITNPSGIDSELNTTIDLLSEHEAFDVHKLFGPEHGIRGDAQAGVKVDDSIDEQTGLPVKSLYGEQRRLQPEMLEGLDTVIYDMQDVGCRFYTLIYTLAYALEGVAEAEKRLVVLDRPNPVAPLGVVGNRIEGTSGSFVGNYGLPITHGMTVGELAEYFNEEFEIGADLTVIEMRDWERSDWYSETGLPWVYPSPNMPTLQTATIYPGTCLFEGTNLSEGRGTTRPFELIGAPWISAEEWATELNALDIEGVGFRPVHFTPTFSKHERDTIEGVQVHVLDRDAVNPVVVGLTMLISAFSSSNECEWLEYDNEYFVDKLAGGEYLRSVISDVDEEDSPREVAETVLDHWENERSGFENIREQYLRYQE
ncbi:hypothetical protein AUR64_04210 [Haloprofundus marisrubri]|uniref:DUF1343 domain-containing protein n=1 Tax=Haloprofundus marisrubri TaxID=1514971 RepID=A0A0W1RDF9_9EURY|nr:DUF1343 domain-containing protein [Haloprofundus marisrubri]KTG11464.1 hypothetical protein AUR64_04210 [Haloprofundus marisrubri]